MENVKFSTSLLRLLSVTLQTNALWLHGYDVYVKELNSRIKLSWHQHNLDVGTEVAFTLHTSNMCSAREMRDCASDWRGWDTVRMWLEKSACACGPGGRGGDKAVQLLGLDAGQLYCSDSSNAQDVRYKSYGQQIFGSYCCTKNETKPVLERPRFWKSRRWTMYKTSHYNTVIRQTLVTNYQA
jgi:hypothetical protein